MSQCIPSTTTIENAKENKTSNIIRKYKGILAVFLNGLQEYALSLC
jgi:hypothetical protein